MSLRISSLGLLAVLLAGCGVDTSPEPEGTRIECAVGPGAEFESTCTLERLADGGFVIHHPDGGFRRFVLDDEGKVENADGAEPFGMSFSFNMEPAMVELAVGPDRYRMEQATLPQSPDE